MRLTPRLTLSALKRYGATVLLLLSTVAEAEIPSGAYEHRAYLIEQSQLIFGDNAPVALFAAQIHKESSWREDAESAHAQGMTQFTPATIDWIVDKFPELGPPNIQDPRWAIRAMLVYNKYLYDQYSDADTECDRWSFVLSAYNGGPLWVERDQGIARRMGYSPYVWKDNTEHWSARSSWAFTENRKYVRRIIYEHQPKYLADQGNWPGSSVCLP